MATPKKPKFDTSFAFGVNARKKGTGGKQAKTTRQAYSEAYRAGQHPRQTGAGGGS
jgi:hypothetical protein